jgi:ubiquinol-cytochrome c reductase subunit 6
MGFFDSLSELLEAATPWSSVEAEAPTTGGASDKSTPATQDGGEGEAEVCKSFVHVMVSVMSRH